VNIRNIPGLAAAGVAVILLAGCSGTAEVETPATSAEPVVESASPTAEVTETADAPADLPGDFTAAGAQLAIGDTALLNWNHYEHGDIQLAVTVTAVREGTLADFDALDLNEETAAQIQGYTPFYIDVTVVKADLSQEPIEFSSISSNIDAINAGGAALPSFTVFGDFALCDDESFDPEVDTGVAQSTCAIFMVPSGQEFGSAQWTDYDTIFDKFDGAPINWS
jgi:outer membrane murein-binding lipoprotein Lpp